MTYLETLNNSIDMCERLLSALNEIDLGTKEGKTMRRILLGRKHKYTYLIEAFYKEPAKLN